MITMTAVEGKDDEMIDEDDNVNDYDEDRG